MSPTEPYRWQDCDNAIIVKFCHAFRECFQALIDGGHIECVRRLSLEDYQRIMTPKITEAAEIMLNAPRRRGKAWPQPNNARVVE